MLNAALFSSAFGAWETPLRLFAELHKEFDFTLDAAANAENTKCDQWLGPGSPLSEDALAVAWQGRVFCNPPYGRGVGAWVEHAVKQTDAEVVVLLLPARMDTRWFQANVRAGHELRFLKGRLRFESQGKPGGPAPFPSMLWIMRGAS